MAAVIEVEGHEDMKMLPVDASHHLFAATR